MISIAVDATWIGFSQTTNSFLQPDPAPTFAETFVAADLEEADSLPPLCTPMHDQTSCLPTSYLEPKPLTQANRLIEDLTLSVSTILPQANDASMSGIKLTTPMNDLIPEKQEHVGQKQLLQVALTVKSLHTEVVLTRSMPDTRAHETVKGSKIPKCQLIYEEPAVEQPSAINDVALESKKIEVDQPKQNINTETNPMPPSETATKNYHNVKMKGATNKDSLFVEVTKGTGKGETKDYIGEVGKKTTAPETRSEGHKEKATYPSDTATSTSATLIPITPDNTCAVIGKTASRSNIEMTEAGANMTARPRAISQTPPELTIGALEATPTSGTKRSEASGEGKRRTDFVSSEPDSTSLMIGKSSLEVSAPSTFGILHGTAVRPHDAALLNTSNLNGSNERAAEAASPNVRAASSIEIRLPELKAESASGLARDTGIEHGLFTVTQTSLEVGIANGSHGWLKVRAEMQNGLVTATIATGSAAGREMLHRDLPMLSTFLEGEKIGVASIEVKETLLPAMMFQRGGDNRQDRGGHAEHHPRGEDGNTRPRRSDGVFRGYGQLGCDGLSNEFLSSIHFIPTLTAGNGSWLNVRV